MNNGDKKADLAGPGISTYEEVEKILPTDYTPLLPPLKRMDALFAVFPSCEAYKKADPLIQSCGKLKN